MQLIHSVVLTTAVQQTEWLSYTHACCCAAAQSALTLCDPMDCSTPGFPVLHHLKLTCIESMMPSNHLILCHPLLLPSVFPSIRVFSSELALRIRWPQYWSFSFSISSSSECSGLISVRIDWFDLLAVQGTLRSLFQHLNPLALSLFSSPTLMSVYDYCKNHSFD